MKIRDVSSMRLGKDIKLQFDEGDDDMTLKR